jgi:hypothetical protein
MYLRCTKKLQTIIIKSFISINVKKAQSGSTLSLTLALDGVGVQRHAPVALPPGKTRYPLYRRLGGPQNQSERVRKISPTTGIRTAARAARSK